MSRVKSISMNEIKTKLWLSSPRDLNTSSTFLKLGIPQKRKSMTPANNWRQLLVLVIFQVGFSVHALGDRTTCVAHHCFGLRLSSRLGLQHPHSNVITSPILMQTALVLLYAGATPNSLTAEELRQSVDLQYLGSPNQAGQHFQDLLEDLKQISTSDSDLRDINRFYTKKSYTFNYRDEFQDLGQRLGIEMERLDYKTASSGAEAINSDFRRWCNCSNAEMISHSDVSAFSTPFLHVSALKFRAPWLQGFDPQETQQIQFFSDGTRHKLVDGMFGLHRYKYAENKALDAQLIELPFRIGDLWLLIIFPNKLDGLKELESQLHNYDIQDLRRQMSDRKVALTLPKMKISTQIDLKQGLKELGLSKIFTPEAELSKAFATLPTFSNPQLSAVRQSIQLELNESGGTVNESFSWSNLFRRTQPLVINHPFFFAIGNDKSLLLAGHIVDIDI